MNDLRAALAKALTEPEMHAPPEEHGGFLRGVQFAINCLPAAALSQAGEPGREVREAFDAMVLVTKWGQPCYRTANGVPQGMPKAVERKVRKALAASSGATREGATFPLTLSDGSVVTRLMDAPGDEGTPFYRRTKPNELIAESYDWLHCITASDSGADHDKLKAAALAATNPGASHV